MPVPAPRLLAAACVAAMLPAASARADAPDVVASIKPIHSLVAGVMGDLGSPHLLVSGADSPHTYAMRPSDADALSRAKVVFWVGEALETFLERPIASLGSGARAVELIHAPGLTLLDYADDDDHHEDHSHDHDHDDDTDHAHDGDHDHDHDEHAAHDHDHDGEEGHHHTGLDPHVWLDPANARAIVAEIVAVLSEVDPMNADTYRRNGESVAERLGKLESDVAAKLEPYRNVPYFTFHESFRYFDNRFGLDSHGAITVSPERQPGARRLKEIREEIEEAGHACIFAEPQFPPRLVDVIVEGTTARTGTLDPLGAALEPGPDLYFGLIEADADSFATCFQSTM